MLEGFLAQWAAGNAARDRRWATLRFDRTAAQWAGREQWHPEQRDWFETDGSYALEVPYSDERELVGDILRHGEGVVVTGPADLRANVQQTLLRASMRYVA